MVRNGSNVRGMGVVMPLIIEETFRNTIAYIQERNHINVNTRAALIGIIFVN